MGFLARVCLLGCGLLVTWALPSARAIYHPPDAVTNLTDDTVTWKESACSIELDGNGSSEFPPDLFTEMQRKNGAIILHFIFAFYCFGMIAIICGEYFLPSVDCICSDLNLSQDVAGATFMSLATSVPEFFVALIGTFITMTDIGLGAVVGSGMFNILGIATCSGLAASKSIKFSWWPLYRDGVTYVLAVAALVGVTWDEYVDVADSVSLLLVYVVYFLIILNNSRLLRLTRSALKSLRRWMPKNAGPGTGPGHPGPVLAIIPPIIEVTDLEPSHHELQVFKDRRTSVSGQHKVTEMDDEEVAVDSKPYKTHFLDVHRSSRRSSRVSSRSVVSDNNMALALAGLSATPSQNNEMVRPGVVDSSFRSSGSSRVTIAVIEISVDHGDARQLNQQEATDDEDYSGIELFSIPDGSAWEVMFWVLMLPASIVFFITVPDCRVKRWRKFYPFTFLMCVVWIGIVSYLATWMIVIIGDTIGIPDSVMGLTFLAAGGSMPEAISTVIIARQGIGGVGFSNGIGCNILDICLCLAIPWFIKSLITGAPVRIESSGIKYNILALVVGTIVLIIITTANKFQINKKLGIICFVCYSLFIVISILVEVGIIVGPQQCIS